MHSFKCLFFGHDWMQKGYNRIRHTTFDGNEIVDSVYKDHFLFFCRKCSKIREHECEYNYYDLSEDSPVFSIVEDEFCDDET